jgi:predicted DNA-binding protein
MPDEVEERAEQAMVRLSRETSRRLLLLARERGLSVADYLDERYGPQITADYVAALDAARERVAKEATAAE